MNSREFHEIAYFLKSWNYPETIELSAQQLWNFKRKAAPYTLSELESKRLYKVWSFIS